MASNQVETSAASAHAEVARQPGLEARAGASGRLITRERIAYLGLILILLLGASYRFTGLNWDENHHLHPDERFLTDIGSQLRTPNSFGQYLRTSESPLNPNNLGDRFSYYVYGNFPMTVVVYVAHWFNSACSMLATPCAHNYTAYDGIHLVGRFLSGLLDLISITFIFLIGKRLYNWRVGLLAALLLALAVMPIQQSHFFTMDNWAATLCTVALYCVVRAAEEARSKRWWLLFGLFLGLAVSSRINVAPLAALAGVAAVLWLARRERQHGTGDLWHYINTPGGSIDLQVVVLGVLLAAFVSLLTFRFAQPYAFADQAIVRETALAETGREPATLTLMVKSALGFNPLWRDTMQRVQGDQSPEANAPPAVQWTARAPILFPLTNMVLYGMGLGAGVAAWLGLLWALWRVLRGRPDWTVHAIPVAWAAGYFLFMATRWVKSIRYFLPVYPVFLLLGAWLLVTLWRRSRGHAWRRALAIAAVLLTIAPTFLWANAFVHGVYREPMTRLAASRWMFENIPSGATLLYEVDGRPQELHLPLKGYLFEPNGFPINLTFSLPQAGTVTGVRFNYISLNNNQPATLRLGLAGPDGQLLDELEADVNVQGERQELLVPLDRAALGADRPYTLRAEHVAGGVVSADTSRIVNEQWDDLLPVSVDGRAAYSSYFSEVSGGQRPVPWPATEEKRQLMLQWIDEADVISLSSQRSLWNTPRIPLTYPLNIAYYRALFSGELGFELVAQFHADLNMGPLHVSDTGGELGWGAPPEIGWPPPGELAAEEAFSVYDHPPVWIFRKTAAYDPQRAQAILDAVDMSAVVHMNPGQATQVPNGLLLRPGEQQIQRENGTFADLFHPDGLLSRQPWLAAIVWWLATFLLGWLALPLAYVAFPGLPDRGYVVARILALLAISWLAWFLASYQLILHNRAGLIVSVTALTLVSGVLFVTHRQRLAQHVRSRLSYFALVELLGVLLFLFFAAIRLGNPDVWDVIWGGEKPMDLSYFTAVMKSSTFPPYDPWYAGGYINYYYYGFVFAGVLPELLGIVPTVAYNLLLCTLFSFTGLGAFGVAFNLVAHLRPTFFTSPQSARSGRALLRHPATVAGLSSAALCVLLGNLGQPGVVLGAWQNASQRAINTGVAAVDSLLRAADGLLNVTIGGQSTPIYPGDWFWTATRAIGIEPGEVAPITEFPFFTFLYGDLHAHMIALPLSLLALTWVVSMALHAHHGANANAAKLPWLSAAALWFCGALAIGVLRPTNTWDWPTFLFLGCLAACYFAFVQGGQRLTLPVAGHAALLIAVLGLVSTLLFWPYIANYGAGYESLRLWQGSYTSVGNYLVIHGLFLFLIVTHLAREWRHWTRSWQPEHLADMRPIMPYLLLGLGVYVLLILFMLLRSYWIAPIVLTLAMVAGLLSLRPGLPVARRVVLLLMAAGLALTLLVEIVVLEGDIGRMNTVFKFYMQVWLLFSVTGGVALALALPAIRARAGGLRRTWTAAFAVLVACAMLYPLLAIPARWNVRMSRDAPHTLDGMAFMQTTQYQDSAFDGSSRTVHLGSEYEALRWMQRHIDGSPVIVEAAPPDVGEAYRSIASRVAMYTGLPTIIGWDWHQTQQRAALTNNQIHRRMNDVAMLYNTTSPGEALDILRHYDVSYVYIGTQEALYYLPEGLAKFEQMAAQGLLRQVFRNADVAIYEVLN